MNLLVLALAPILIILFYIYIRDKYNKEPLGMLLKSLIAGMFITLPVVFTESGLHSLYFSDNPYASAGYSAFIVAGLTEEFFKFLALYFLIWKSRHFDEKFDGIVYGVFVSLGFAAVENVMYVYQLGHSAGFTRALTAVPAHAIFGVIMGYYFSRARFGRANRQYYLMLALFVPVMLHGIYNFILMTGHRYMLLAFIPYLIYLWRTGFRRMREMSVK